MTTSGEYFTINGSPATPPFHKNGGLAEDAQGWVVRDASGNVVSWAEYQHDLAVEAALAFGGGGYAGRPFVSVVFDDDGLRPLRPTERPPARRPQPAGCTCGARAAGLGEAHSSWCDAPEARVQHEGRTP